MADNTESRKPVISESPASAAIAPVNTAKTIKLYSDCYVGESMSQHHLYGIEASVTEEGFLYIYASEALAEANEDREFPLLDELAYRKMVKDITKARR